MLKRDKQATEARHFLDPRSYVAQDLDCPGREVLYGKDWKARKKELWERAGGQCEYLYPQNNARCREDCRIPSHIIPRHPKRNDLMNNLKAYCIPHDKLMEKQNRRRIRSDRAEHRLLPREGEI